MEYCWSFKNVKESLQTDYVSTVALKGECSVFKKKVIMNENDALSKYNKIPLGHNRTNGAVYSKIYFKKIKSALHIRYSVVISRANTAQS